MYKRQALNLINVPDHGFNSGETLSYSGNASGLINDQTYIITKINSDKFKLSLVGVGITSKLFYYDTNQYVNIDSIGSGLHTFNYPEISVTVSGKIGVSTFSGQDFNAKLQPIFRGSIESVDLTNNGVGYGASEIINLNRQPSFKLLSGRDAELLPIVNNGKIEVPLGKRHGIKVSALAVTKGKQTPFNVLRVDEVLDNKSVLVPLNNAIEFSNLNGKSIQFLGDM